MLLPALQTLDIYYLSLISGPPLPYENLRSFTSSPLFIAVFIVHTVVCKIPIVTYACEYL